MNPLLQSITNRAQSNPDAIVVQTESALTSYADFIEQINVLAEKLEAEQITLLALYAENSLGWLVVDLACQIAKITLLPIPSFFSNLQIEFVLSSSDADAMIASNSFSSNTILQEKKPLKLIDNLNLYGLSNKGQVQNSEVLIPDNTAKITFTSGSTGNPKGVCLSVEQMLTVAQSVAQMLPSEKISKHLCILPLAVLLENIAGVYTSLFIGARVILLPMEKVGFSGSSQFTPSMLIKTLNEYRPNSHILLPQLLDSLLQSNSIKVPNSLKFIAVGGGKVAPSQIERARNLGLPVYEGYGLSESASVVCLNINEKQKSATVGQFLPHIKAFIADDNELIIEGKTFLGYLNDPSSWNLGRLATGDLCEQDDEGFISIKGRKKNLIISSFGRNISPEWVESLIHQIHGIHQCIIFGDAKPFCIALITLHQELNAQQLELEISVINEQLPDYAQVRAWSVLSNPLTTEDGFLTANGRPKRDVIAAQFEQEIEALYP